MSRALIIAAYLLLTACADTAPIVKLVPAAPPQIPQSLLTCPASPQVPGDQATQADVGRYLLDLYDSGAECRGNLGAVAKLLKDSKPEDQQ